MNDRFMYIKSIWFYVYLFINEFSPGNDLRQLNTEIYNSMLHLTNK